MAKKRWHRANILYCPGFPSHRTHRELVRRGSEHGWIINAVSWNESDEGTYTGGFPIDGVISHLPPQHAAELARNIGEAPHVTLHAHSASQLRIPGAVSGHAAAGRMVAEHFIELGFSNFAAFVDRGVYGTFTDRLAGFSDVVSAAGLQAPTTVALPGTAYDSYEKTLAIFGHALESMTMPLAIMAANDRAAVKVMNACRQNDLSMPAQVAICGFDNDPIACDLAPVPLSSVDTDPESQAREAVRVLASLLEGAPAPSEPVVIEPKGLVVRRSSGVPAHGGATVARALAYIHEHAWASDLGIPEIAQHVGVSKTNLFASFRRELARTPLQYLTELRIAKARRLLTETELKVNEVRPRCGFSTDYQMYQAFKRTTGRSPGTFRHS